MHGRWKSLGSESLEVRSKGRITETVDVAYSGGNCSDKTSIDGSGVTSIHFVARPGAD